MSTARPLAQRFDMGRLAVAAAVTATVGVGLTIAIRALTSALVKVPARFSPLQAPEFILVTIMAVIVAALACAVLDVRVREPRRTFRLLAAPALALSFVPDIGIWVAGAYQHAARSSTVLPLMAMHVAVAALCVVLLPALGGAPTSPTLG